MKKKFLFFSLSMMVSSFSFSQLEVKLEPISLIFGQIPISAEYVITDYIGIEARAGYYFSSSSIDTTASTGLTTSGLLKFYFNPKHGGDRFYAFPYVRNVSRKYTVDYNNTQIDAKYNAFGVGFGVGYKIVSKSGLLFDIGLGVGKNFSKKYTYSDPAYVPLDPLFDIDINFLARLSIGYRLWGLKDKGEKIEE